MWCTTHRAPFNFGKEIYGESKICAERLVDGAEGTQFNV